MKGPRLARIPVYGAGSKCLAAPRKRQNGSGFTLHSPRQFPLQPYTPRFPIPLAPGRRRNENRNPTTQDVADSARIKSDSGLHVRPATLCPGGVGAARRRRSGLEGRQRTSTGGRPLLLLTPPVSARPPPCPSSPPPPSPPPLFVPLRGAGFFSGGDAAQAGLLQQISQLLGRSG